MSKMHAEPEHTAIVEIAKTIRKAWYSDRTIVPVVGAGLSADSGFPVLRSVIRYLGKLYASIENGAPLEMVSFAGATLLKDKIDKRTFRWSSSAAPRHRGIINALFLDASVRTTYLVELDPSHANNAKDFWRPGILGNDDFALVQAAISPTEMARFVFPSAD